MSGSVVASLKNHAHRILVLFAVTFLMALCPYEAARADVDSVGVRVYVVTTPSAQVYSTASTERPAAMKLSQGRRVQGIGEEVNGFIRLSTKSGAPAWLKLSDVTLESELEGAGEADLSEPPVAVQKPRRQAQPGPFGFQRVTFDLGASGGSYNDKNYMEVDLGVNAYLSEYLAFRNAIFGRFQTGEDSLYGLDSSMRAIVSADAGVAGVTAFAGPGFRFVTKGNHVPFLEGGLVLKLGPFSIGGGVKSLVYNVINRERSNDVQYFFILAGGGSL